ncbi:uncharacterized protein N7483_013164 [Penicillium malachiteum]|uniref:uncharacterized protein n=1 Tax=Penicillium malachiteum TaxID=1324776 RepID=UPI0025491C91|nr:uncharacterized protein N7483_013164 [Penicillium malachiteum]KAJ5715983.1 hypothetical protein N7483_013164 [Penicillium malachiteum]
MRKFDHSPFTIKGRTVAQIQGKYREGSVQGPRGSDGASATRGLSPATARQLFTSTVAPVVDYASNVWMHACKDKAVGPINRVQRVGAQAIVGTFLTVATSIAEAEAHIATAQR